MYRCVGYGTSAPPYRDETWQERLRTVDILWWWPPRPFWNVLSRELFPSPHLYIYARASSAIPPTGQLYWQRCLPSAAYIDEEKVLAVLMSTQGNNVPTWFSKTNVRRYHARGLMTKKEPLRYWTSTYTFYTHSIVYCTSWSSFLLCRSRLDDSL